MAAAPKQLMAEMPKMTANVMPTASRATPALWRFLALARMFSTGVGSGFRAKNCRAQAEPLPPAARAAFFGLPLAGLLAGLNGAARRR